MLIRNCVVLACLLTLCFTAINAEAGCNGSCSVIEGEDWLVTDDTHMFDETLEIRHLTVNPNVNLKLENVNLNISGHVVLNGDSEWINSNINHHREDIEHNISIYSKLEIISSTLSMNGTGSYFSYPAMYLGTGSEFIVKDSDNDPNTKEDSSTIQSLNWNSSMYYYTGWQYQGGTDGKLSISNSNLKHLYYAFHFGNASEFINNNITDSGQIRLWGHDIVYENNTHENGFTWYTASFNHGGKFSNNTFANSVRGFYFGAQGNLPYTDNITVENNTFDNLTYHGIYYSGGSNVSIRNNFFNNSGDGIYYGNGNNVSITNNEFKNVGISTNLYNVSNVKYYNNYISGSGADYATGFSGTNVNIYDNIISDCRGKCILVTNSMNTINHENITVENNIIKNFRGSQGITIASSIRTSSNYIIKNNTIEGDWQAPGLRPGVGIGTLGWYTYTELPNLVTISNNTISNVTTGIRFFNSGLYTQDLEKGEDYLITENTISNSSKGIQIEGKLGGLYSDLEITNNQLMLNSTGNGINFDMMKNINVNNNFIDFATNGVIGHNSENFAINENIINSSIDGLRISKSDGSISDNLLTGICYSGNCDRVSFTDVGKNGINLSLDSEASLWDNNIRMYYTTLVVSDSEIVSMYMNNLNFTNTGILTERSILNILSNNLNNSYYGLKDFNSIVIINGLNLNNFNTGITGFNTTYTIQNHVMNEGSLCIDLTDSTYIIDSWDNLECPEAILYEKYFFNVRIETNEGIASPQHLFSYKNSRQTSLTNGFTGEDGYSKYSIALTKKVDNAGLVTNFNPFTFTYNHNGIGNSFNYNIESNSTVFAYLDTVSPITRVTANASILNDLNIYLNFNKLSEKNDLLNYDLYVLINDGVNFAEWEYVGTYNQSIVKYEGINGNKYRFKSISKDIYGNIESKTSFDYEVGVDTETPESYFSGIGSNYYFTSNNEVLLDWKSYDDDIYVYNIKIHYTNFTTDYLDWETVVWEEISNNYYFGEGSEFYIMENIGHYAFKVTAIDTANNAELKDEYDFIINFDPKSDKLAFTDVPDRWGYDSLEIEFEKANFNLDFKLYLALESVEYSNPYFNWYSHPHNQEDNEIRLTGLLDKTRYYLYAESTDLAGNIENPLNTTEYFSANGEYAQTLKLTYIPIMKYQYPFTVTVDNDLDGTYETKLVRSEKLNGMAYDGYYLDVRNKTIHLGNPTGGFVPTEDLEGMKNIKIEYSGVHAIFEVYTGNPDKANNLLIEPTNTTHIIFGYTIPNDAKTCKVQSTTNISKGWFNQEILSPCKQGSYEYEILNPQLDKQYFFRIMLEDEFGHTSYSDNRSIDMEDIVKLYNVSPVSDNDQFGMREILPGAIGISLLFLLFGGVLMYRTREDDSVNETLIESKPVAKYKVEELYLIYKDGRLIRNLSAVEVKTDSEIMSGMLTAINDFVQDSFNTEGDLGDIGYGNNKIILQRGRNSYLAAVIYGETDNFFKSKMARAVRGVEQENPTIGSWNGDSETIKNVKPQLEPIITETTGVTREMVDNYFNEKEIIVTTSYEIEGDNIKLTLNVSNYSADLISGCKIRPQFNDSVLRLGGIEPDVAYSFSENSFTLGDLNSYSEIQSVLKMKLIVSGKTSVEIKMDYLQKGRDSTTSSTIDIE